jgi:hypothetical protein
MRVTVPAVPTAIDTMRRPGMRLTGRDERIVETLASRVRVMHLGQVGRGFWPGSEGSQREVGRRLSRLVAAGLISVYLVHARLLEPRTGPVGRWAPGEPAPDFDRYSYALQSRWSMAPRTTRVFIAGPKLGALWGVSAGRLRKPLQIDHDLALSEAYLWFLRDAPELAARWVIEDRLPKVRSERNPDALVFDPSGERPVLAVESGGAYPAERVASFHAHCERLGLPYELW